MISGFMSGIITAFILSLFGFDHMFTEVMQSFTLSPSLTTSHYYVFFGFIGMLGGAFRI